MHEGSRGNRVDTDRMAVVREKLRAASASVLAGLVLTVLKLAAGLATASLGLLAEAAHSALDFGAAVITWFAVRSSWHPPDADHQYGHGKIENLSALAETVLLVVTSIWILIEAFQRMLGGGPEVRPSVWAFGVVAVSIVVDVIRSRDLAAVARRSGSQALEADALHFSTDIASSSVVIVGLAGAALASRPGLEWLRVADPLAAGAVALLVLFLSWRLGKRAVDMLLDRAPADLRARVLDALAGQEGVVGAPRVRTRQAGDTVFVDVEVPTRPGIPVAEGERLAGEARERIRAVTGAGSSVLVQLRAADAVEVPIRERIATAVAAEAVQAHNITVRSGESGSHVDLHLELPGTWTLARGHAVADRVERRILSDVPGVARVDIHLELHDAEPEPAGLLQDAERERLERRVLGIAQRLTGPGAVHDLLLARTPSGLYLSCHYFLPPDLSLADAHEWTDRLEREILDEIPEIRRVAVHAEPREEG